MIKAPSNIAADKFSNDANIQVVDSMNIPDNWEGLDIGPNSVIKTTSIAPVGIVLPSSAMATLPPDSISAMIPEPTTVASKKAVPTN